MIKLTEKDKLDFKKVLFFYLVITYLFFVVLDKIPKNNKMAFLPFFGLWLIEGIILTTYGYRK